MALKKQPDEKLVAVRLSAEELEALEKMVKIGVAANTSEAIRLAVRLAPVGLATKVVADIEALKDKVEGISAQLTKVDLDKPLRRNIHQVSKARLIEEAESSDLALKLAATEELLARGYFPDGLGNWVEDRPDTSIPGRSGGRVGSPRASR